jgi:hypothetical protein
MQGVVNRIPNAIREVGTCFTVAAPGSNPVCGTGSSMPFILTIRERNDSWGDDPVEVVEAYFHRF